MHICIYRKWLHTASFPASHYLKLAEFCQPSGTFWLGMPSYCSFNIFYHYVACGVWIQKHKKSSWDPVYYLFSYKISFEIKSELDWLIYHETDWRSDIDFFLGSPKGGKSHKFVASGYLKLFLTGCNTTKMGDDHI